MSEKIERRDALAMLAMEQQTAEIKFEGEQLGSHTDNTTTYTLYSVASDSVPDDVYVVHVDEGDESWLETNSAQGMSEGMIGMFFPELAEACGVERVFPHNFGGNGGTAKHAKHR